MLVIYNVFMEPQFPEFIARAVVPVYVQEQKPEFEPLEGDDLARMAKVPYLEKAAAEQRRFQQRHGVGFFYWCNGMVWLVTALHVVADVEKVGFKPVEEVTTRSDGLKPVLPSFGNFIWFPRPVKQRGPEWNRIDIKEGSVYFDEATRLFYDCIAFRVYKSQPESFKDGWVRGGKVIAREIATESPEYEYDLGEAWDWPCIRQVHNDDVPKSFTKLFGCVFRKEYDPAPWGSMDSVCDVLEGRSFGSIAGSLLYFASDLRTDSGDSGAPIMCLENGEWKFGGLHSATDADTVFKIRTKTEERLYLTRNGHAVHVGRYQVNFVISSKTELSKYLELEHTESNLPSEERQTKNRKVDSSQQETM